MKEYKLLVDSPDLPKGSIAIQADDGLYDVIYPDGGIIPGRISPRQIEGRPSIWGYIVDDPLHPLSLTRQNNETIQTAC